MKPYAALIALVLPLFAVPAHAGPELAAKSKCMMCHDVDKKKMGPSFKEISARYKDDKTAAATLNDSILTGAKGKWGKVPMAPQKVAPANAQKLSEWILSL